MKYAKRILLGVGISIALVALATLAACASVPVPTESAGSKAMDTAFNCPVIPAVKLCRRPASVLIDSVVVSLRASSRPEPVGAAAPVTAAIPVRLEPAW